MNSLPFGCSRAPLLLPYGLDHSVWEFLSTLHGPLTGCILQTSWLGDVGSSSHERIAQSRRQKIQPHHSIPLGTILPNPQENTRDNGALTGASSSRTPESARCAKNSKLPCLSRDPCTMPPIFPIFRLLGSATATGWLWSQLTQFQPLGSAGNETTGRLAFGTFSL